MRSARNIVIMNIIKNKLRNKLVAFWFLFPYFSLYIIFFFIPVITLFPISLTKWNIIDNPEFIGTRNYYRLFQDELFWKALGNTFYYTALVTIVLTIIGLFLAILLNQKIKGRLFARTVVLIPFVISSAAAGILWKWIYDKNFGFLNSYLRQLGLPIFGWLSNVRLAIPSIVIMNIWWSVAFNTIIYLAALQGIPKELYEAAEIDGASKFQLFRFITLPMLRPITLYVTVLCAANSFQMFDEAYIMTQGGPVGRTLTLVYRIFIVAFNNFEFGYASALSFVTLGIILIITILQFKIISLRE